MNNKKEKLNKEGVKKVFSLFWKFGKKYSFSFFLNLSFFIFVIIISSVIIPLFIKNLIDALNQKEFQEAIHFVFVVFGLFLLSDFFTWVSDRMNIIGTTGLQRDLNSYSFNQLSSKDYDFYTRHFTGSVVEKIGRLGERSINVIYNFIYNIINIIIVVGSILVVLFYKNISIAIIFLIFSLFYFIFSFFAGKKFARFTAEVSEAKNIFMGTISDIIMNIMTVKIFSSLPKEKKLFSKVNESFYSKRKKAWSIGTNFQSGVGLFPSLFIGIVVLYATHLASQGKMSVGTVILIFLFGTNLSRVIRSTARSIRFFYRDLADIIGSINLMEEKDKIGDPPNAENISISSGDVTFRDVSFTYPKGDSVFRNFPLHIPAGQSVGVVGKSGSGKTTLVKLLLRFYDPQKGEILIDGQNIRNIPKDDLRNTIAYIPQETVLFHRTLRENIAYGKDPISNEDFELACKYSYVDEFARELKDGYETKVGERGVKLSGGQRQRVGIARAFIRSHVPLLIMDEATSSLDSMSEHYIQEAFERLSKNRTTIVIAHRLSTIQKLDRILVFENGKIIEDGDHSELIKKGGFYAKLWDSQVNGFIE